MQIETPYRGATAVVLPGWIDHNGHVNVGYYHIAFDVACDRFFEWLGLTPEFRRRHRASVFALESHLSFVRELREGDPLRFEARLLDFDHKRLHFYQEMYHATGGWLAATHEWVSAYIDIGERRTAPMPAELTARLQPIREAHAALPRPWQIGHRISLQPPPRG